MAINLSRSPRKTDLASYKLSKEIGPGTYSVPQEKSMNMGDAVAPFGVLQERANLAATNDNPGPGWYD